MSGKVDNERKIFGSSKKAGHSKFLLDVRLKGKSGSSELQQLLTNFVSLNLHNLNKLTEIRKTN